MGDVRAAAIYFATVKEIGDAEKHFGWLKLVLANKEIMSHPIWAQPAFSTHHFFIPKIGDRVLVFFESGSWNDAYWFGQRSDETVAPKEAVDGYPTSQVIQSPSGHTIEMNDKAGSEEVKIKSAPKDGQSHSVSLNTATEEIVIEHASAKTRLTVRQDGSIEILTDAVKWDSKDSTFTMGNVKLTAGKTLEIVDANSNRVQLDENRIRISDKRRNSVDIGKAIIVTDKSGSQIKMDGGKVTINAKGDLILNNGSRGVVRVNDRATPHTHNVVAPAGGGPCVVSPAIVTFPATSGSRRVKAG